EDRFFEFIGNENLAGVPVPFALCVVIVIAMAVTMRTTAFGRRIFAVGGNETATYYSGINVARVKIGAYVLCAVLGGIAALLYAGYDRQGNPSSGAFYELNAIAAAVVGGASLMGGEGSMIGTFLGAGILQVILNGINLIIRQGSSLWEGVIVGIVVVAAVAFNTLRARRR
ncbi:MAG: ABC transporter permease, partial [bacterium]